MESASQQDIDRLRDDLGKGWADQRDRLTQHADEDRNEFRAVRAELGLVRQDLGVLRDIVKEWTGALGISKWALGLGIPAILGALITHIVRHW